MSRMRLLCCILLIALLGAAPVSADILQQIAPTPTTYTQGVDFLAFAAGDPTTFGSVPGDVTAMVFDVGGLGCSADEFAGFPAGYIALVDRGSCFFSDKGLNAATAGATGFLVANSVPGVSGGTLFDFVGIPGMMLSQELGTEFRSILASGPLTVRMEVVVPEPSAWEMTGLGVVCALLLRRRHLRQRGGL